MTSAGNFDIIFNCDEGTHPKLLKAYLAKKISLETLVILDRLVRYRRVFDREIDESYIWPKVSMLIQKYEPFVKVNIVKCRRMLIEKTREFINE